MSVSNIELIKHIFDECDFISTHTNGKDSNQVINDKVLVRASNKLLYKKVMGTYYYSIDEVNKMFL